MSNDIIKYARENVILAGNRPVVLQEMPDYVMQYAMDNWSEAGYKPFFVFRLCERGYLHCEIDFAMKKIIGDDWLEHNASVWIDRLVEKGLPSMIHSLEHDTPPVIDILCEEISIVLAREYPEKLCDHCIKIMEQRAYSEFVRDNPLLITND